MKGLRAEAKLIVTDSQDQEECVHSCIVFWFVATVVDMFSMLVLPKHLLPVIACCIFESVIGGDCLEEMCIDVGYVQGHHNTSRLQYMIIAFNIM